MTTTKKAYNLSVRDKLIEEMDRMVRDWQQGRNASPDERDYVLAAARLLEVNPSDELVEKIADELYEKHCDGKLQTSAWTANFVLRRLDEEAQVS